MAGAHGRRKRFSMKKNCYFLFYLAVSFFFALPADFVVASYMPSGFLDSASCAAFTGWSCDHDNNSQTITVKFYADGTDTTGTFLGSMAANLPGNSGVGAVCGGYINHAYSFTTPASIKDNKAHSIYAYALDYPSQLTTKLLTGAPKSIQCACTSECAPEGSRQCSGSGFQVCGDFNGTGCTSWSSITACQTGQTCSAGSCVTNADCDQKSYKQCSGGNVYWYDSCGERGDLYQDCGDNAATTNYRCDGAISQKEMIVKDCVDAACSQESEWNDVIDCSKSNKTCKDGACVAGDTTPPALSGLGPSGTLYDASAILKVTTSETADCRYSWYDKNFDGMTLNFSTADRLAHTAAVALSGYGNYTYYVRCRDNGGNINAVAGRISFRYASSQPVANPPDNPADAAPPVISTAGSGSQTTTSGSVVLNVTTDESATCKYDSRDTNFDAMENTMQGAGGTGHSDNVALSAPGDYTYYVRCRDSADNKDKKSTRIDIAYILPKEGPKISDPTPTGTIYQSAVTLAITTDKVADCRYSTADKDYDLMADTFTTPDGQRQMAIVALPDFGNYTYFARCKDAEGNKDAQAAVITFEYANPNPEPEQTGTQTGAQTEPAAPVSCAEYKMGTSDDVCDRAPDCVCDPDCGTGADSQDTDCVSAANQPASNVGITMILAGAGVLILVGIVAAIIIVRKKSAGGIDESGNQSDIESV